MVMQRPAALLAGADCLAAMIDAQLVQGHFHRIDRMLRAG